MCALSKRGSMDLAQFAVMEISRIYTPLESYKVMFISILTQPSLRASSSNAPLSSISAARAMSSLLVSIVKEHLQVGGLTDISDLPNEMHPALGIAAN